MIRRSGPDKIGFIEVRRDVTVAGKGKRGARFVGAGRIRRVSTWKRNYPEGKGKGNGKGTS